MLTTNRQVTCAESTCHHLEFIVTRMERADDSCTSHAIFHRRQHGKLSRLWSAGNTRYEAQASI